MLTFHRFAKFGKIGAFGTPIALLVIDIVLRLLVAEKRTNGTFNIHATEERCSLLVDR